MRFTHGGPYDNLRGNQVTNKFLPAGTIVADEETEAAMRADFRVFLWALWSHLGLPDPTELQYDLAQYLAKGPRRRLIEAFRGCGKSWITVIYVLWRLYINAQEKILVVSASEKLATDFCTFAKRLIDEVAFLQYLRPKRNQRDSVLAFDVGPATAAKDPSVRAAGITGQITGGRASLIVADDIEVPKNSLTEGMREKLAELIKEFDAVLMPEGEVVFLGTPQSMNTVYKQVEERGYIARIWPSRYPDARQQMLYAGRLAPMLATRLAADPTLVGTPTEPSRFSDTDLLEREASYGRSGFQLQFMLDTAMSDANRYPLKLHDLLVMSINKGQPKTKDTPAVLASNPVQSTWALDPRLVILDLPNVGLTGDRFHMPMWNSDQFAPFDGTVMYIDPSGRGKDETSYAIISMLRGVLHLVGVGGLRDGYTDATLVALCNVALQNQVKHVLVEDNFGGGMFTALLSPHMARIYPCTLEDVHSVGQKERRIIDTLEPIMNQHRLVVDRAVIEADILIEEPKYQLFYQLTHLTRDRNSLRHDDKIEAVAGAAAYWVEQLKVDNKKAEASNKAKLMDTELKNFMKTVNGRPSKRANWTRAAGR
jgi:hypothetical protein